MSGGRSGKIISDVIRHAFGPAAVNLQQTSITSSRSERVAINTAPETLERYVTHVIRVAQLRRKRATSLGSPDLLN